MGKRVIYVMYGQFGHAVGSYYYAKYLSQLGYQVGILSADSGKKKIEAPNGINVYYITFEDCANGWQKRKKFIREASKLKNEYDVFVVRYFQFCSLLILALVGRYVYIDYRTGLVGYGKIKIFLNNLFNRIEISFSKKIFILSEDLARNLYIPSSKYIWLPLGADDLSSGKPKEYIDNLNLLYIGTLSHRNLEDTVEGFAKFYMEYKKKYQSLSFHIVGRGSDTEVKKLENAILENSMQDSVFFHGAMTHAESQELFDFCNCGVAYVPETFYYDHQPSTKIFEYNLSGLICVATSTSENRKVISNENGVLCRSTSESFYNALVELYQNRRRYSWESVKESQKIYSWKIIIERVFHQEFKSLK